jgi:hypothetical protein
MSLRAAAAAALLFVGSAQAAMPLDLSGVANARFDSSGFIGGETYPTGALLVSLDGIDYRLPASGNYMWHSADQFVSTPNPRSVSIPVSQYGIDVVYTLMGTWWGEKGTGSLATITFNGSGGLVHSLDLDGGVHIRDYNYNPTYTTTLDVSVTRQVWSNGSGPGSQHIDRQRFDLPAAFDTATLESIVLTDNGSDGVQRAFIAAVTLQPVPEPGTWASLGVGLAVLGGLLTRRHRTSHLQSPSR